MLFDISAREENVKKDFLKYGNLIAFICVVVFNILATVGILGGVTTRDVSYMYKSLLTPKDWAFSIWSLIYVLLAILVVIQFKNDNLREKMGLWFIISCCLNVLWIIAWQFKLIAISFILILFLLLDLLILMKTTKGSNTITNMAVGLYTGWINVAMLANLGALFTRYNWSLLGLDNVTLAVLGLTFGCIWICFFLARYSNVYYAISSSWGYLAISLGSTAFGVKIMAITSLFFIIGTVIWIMIKEQGN